MYIYIYIYYIYKYEQSQTGRVSDMDLLFVSGLFRPPAGVISFFRTTDSEAGYAGTPL